MRAGLSTFYAPPAPPPRQPYAPAAPPGQYPAYGQPPPVVIVQQSAGFDIRGFGEMRTLAMLGAILGLVSTVLPWFSFGFSGANAWDLLSVAGFLTSIIPQFALLVFEGALVAVTSGVGLLLILTKNERRSFGWVKLLGLFTIILPIVYIVALIGVSGGRGAGVIGVGVFVALFGGFMMMIGAAKHQAMLGAGTGYATTAYAVAPGASYPPTIATQYGTIAPTRNALTPAYAPPSSTDYQALYGRPPPAAPARPSFPCPQCSRPVAQGQAVCTACGLALTWD